MSILNYQTILRGSVRAGAAGAVRPEGNSVAANARAGSSTGLGVKGGAASSKAGKSGAVPGFQARTSKVQFLQ